MSLDEVAAGAWAGLVGTVLGYPLDVVKSRMQTGKTGVVSASDAPAKANFGAPRPPSSSTSFAPPTLPEAFSPPPLARPEHTLADPRHPPYPTPRIFSPRVGRTLVRLVKTDGILGMYRGLGPPVCMMMLMNAVNFTAFGALRTRFAGDAPAGWGTDRPWIDWRIVAAGVAVGPLCAAISTPFELVKLQLQLDGANRGGSGNAAGGRGPREYARRRYANSLDAARQLHARFGPRVFYLGWGVNATRECVFHAVFFSTYEHLVHGFREDAGFSPHAATACAGGVAGAAAWAGNLPLDCVKSGVQGQCLGNGGWDGRRGKVGTMEAVREVLRRGGALGFFSGATPSIARSFIVSGSRFTAFSGAMGFFRAMRGEGIGHVEDRPLSSE